MCVEVVKSCKADTCMSRRPNEIDHGSNNSALSPSSLLCNRYILMSSLFCLKSSIQRRNGVMCRYLTP